jgi:hypothetical protein
MYTRAFMFCTVYRRAASGYHSTLGDCGYLCLIYIRLVRIFFALHCSRKALERKRVGDKALAKEVPLPGASSIWDESSCVVDIDEIDEVDLTGESKSSAALAAMHQEDLQQIRTVLEGAGWTANDLPSGIAQVLTIHERLRFG